MEIATVITPHIGGMLTLYEWRGGALVEDGRIHGFSNHQYGSVILDLHEIMDWNGDGVPDIILPDAARRALKVLSFAEGEADMLAEYPLNSPVKGPVTATQTGVAIVLQDDRVISWKKSGL